MNNINNINNLNIDNMNINISKKKKCNEETELVVKNNILEFYFNLLVNY